DFDGLAALEAREVCGSAILEILELGVVVDGDGDAAHVGGLQRELIVAGRFDDAVDVVKIFELALIFFGLLGGGDGAVCAEVHAQSARNEGSEIDVDQNAGGRSSGHVEGTVDGRGEGPRWLDLTNCADGATGKSCAGVVHEGQLGI